MRKRVLGVEMRTVTEKGSYFKKRKGRNSVGEEYDRERNRESDREREGREKKEKEARRRLGEMELFERDGNGKNAKKYKK